MVTFKDQPELVEGVRLVQPEVRQEHYPVPLIFRKRGGRRERLIHRHPLTPEEVQTLQVNNP